MTCDRPGCPRPTEGDDLYCSATCFELDNDPVPVQPIARNKAGGFGLELSRQAPEPVFLIKPKEG